MTKITTTHNNIDESHKYKFEQWFKSKKKNSYSMIQFIKCSKQD